MKYDVVAAIVERRGKYLCMQRCRSEHPYISEHWEFPGGKCKDDETHHETLVREIKEEMDWDIYVGRKVGTVDYSYDDFDIRLTAYLCKGSDSHFKMLEHLDYKWLKREDLLSLNWTAADRKLIENFEF